MRPQEWLDCCKDWWSKDQNPLHIWHAIAVCLAAEPAIPIPDWCISYLATTAANFSNLMGGRDFRDSRLQVTPDQAHALTHAALGLSSQGRKNAFARIADETKLQRHVNNIKYESEATVVKAIAAEHSVSPERARRVLRQAKEFGRRQG